jgi:parallel beta-helix repeat protein
MRLLCLALILAACTDSTTDDTSGVDGTDGADGSDGADGTSDVDPDFPTTSCADYAEPCVEVTPGDVEQLLQTVNLLEDGLTIVLGAGTWILDNQVTLRGASGVSLVGQGMDETVLDFAEEEVQSNGIDVIGDAFLVQGLTVKDAKKDGVRVEDSDGVTMRSVRATWTDERNSENGAYGLYPVKSTRVLVEDCEAFNASDAGIYVGQAIHAVIRNNLASGNVAGIEIENTQYADVYGNTATRNTGGLLIFDLPGNPIVGHDVWVHDNTVTDNNTPNFAPGGTVSVIPAGTGTVVLASRRVVLEDNTYANNNTSDIAVFSGLVIEGDPADWALARAELVGDIEGVNLPGDDTTVYNYQTRDIVLSGNDHSGSGGDADMSDLEARELGFLLGVVYADNRVDDVLYGAIGEGSFIHVSDHTRDDSPLQVVETRLLMRGREGWTAWPYLWRGDGSDADLHLSGEVMALDLIDPDGEPRTAQYLVPQRNQCVDCHESLDADGERVLGPVGPSPRFLHDGTLLEQLVADGRLTGAPELSTLPAATDWASIEAADLSTLSPEVVEDAARSYLHINCAHCHSPNGIEGVTSQLFLN